MFFSLHIQQPAKSELNLQMNLWPTPYGLNLHGLTMNLLHDHPGYKFQLLKANHILYI